MKTHLLPMLSPLLLFSPVHADGEIGFVERFALAKDRTAALQELIPGTEDFYYFSALHAQNEGRLAEVDGFLEPWRDRFGESERFLEIRNRQSLLNYPNDPAGTLGYLKDQLGLSFEHQQQRLDAKPDFPTRLDPTLISREAFLKRALAKRDLSGITAAGLDALLREPAELTPAQRRELLSRLRLPDHEQLVGLIAADLRTRESQGFGEFEIHRRLTLAQLDELTGLRPELAQDPRFVEQRLLRLRPSDDESIARNPEAESAWNDRVWEYVRTLPPAFASMKASVLHRRLELARKRGEFPEEEFLEYLRLPRPVPYMRPEYLREQQRAGASVDLNADFSPTIGLPPIGTDEGLVRDYLEHFFLTDETTNRFSPYLEETWLERVFAETKLLHGLGDASQWFSRLGPARVQELKDRVEIAFAPTNAERFSATDEVTLTATLKNVPELILKVYEINALNFYRERGEEINTDIELDGLVANEEKVHHFGEAPIRRRSETFRFDSLKGKRGVWVIELIGNGISSRALVRKGELQALTQTTVGGELLTVIDEANAPVPKASAWFGGRKYEADEKGLILLPFSESGTVPVVLTDGDFASLAKVALPQENYVFQAGFLLEQETLLPGTEATVAIRPSLTIHGEPVSVSRMKEVRLTLKTTDLDGVESISEAAGFELFDDRESTHTFRVPARLRTVSVGVTGKIDPVAKAGDPFELHATTDFDLNGVEAQEISGDTHLSRIGDGYVVQVLGRSGEALPERPVTLLIRRHGFAEVVERTLKSGPDGRIDLGALSGIASVHAHSQGLPERNWTLHEGRVSRPAVLHAKAGEAVEIPLPLDANGDRSSFAIFETRAGVPVEDLFASAQFGRGLVRLDGLKPGNYEVVLKDEERPLELKVTAATIEQMGYALSRDRHLSLSGKALRLTSAEAKDGKLVVSLAHTDAATRVHLVATRYLPSFDPYAGLSVSVRPPLFEIGRGAKLSRYVSGRDIGEEYRYILERRNAKKFPGNLLSRPGLLLNPWELSETETDVKEAAKGEAYRKSAPAPEAEKRAAGPAPAARPVMALMEEMISTPTFNFLARQAVVLTNLEPGEDGTVSIDLAALGDRQHVHLVAVNGSDTVSHSFALPEPEGGAAIRDLRLETTLDPAKHFTQRRKVTLLKEGQTLTVADFRGSEVQPYGTIGEVYETLKAISSDAGLAEFHFVEDWASHDETKKRELYSKHACHELNFFLAQKDAAFFDAVVKSYLANKKEKTFLDRYLLGENLDSFLAPWEYGRLNIVERILLARRIGEDERQRTAAHVTGLHQLLPPDPEGDAFLYRQALRGRAAKTGGSDDFGNESDAFGFEAPAAPGVQSRSLQNRGASFTAGAAGAAPADSFGTPPAQASAPAAPPALMGRALGLVAEEALLDRAQEQALYQTLDSTKELAENNYRHLPIAEQNADLVTVNRFWRDYANWNGEGGFYSREFPAATSNFTEMMFVLSVLDLPFEEKKHQLDVTENVYKLTAASPLVVFHEEFEEAPLAEGVTPILVSQNFVRADDRQREEDGQMVDKFVTGEFLTGVIYASQVVVTNPTSSFHRLDLLVQVPEGAVPVAGSDYTQSHPLNLGAFSTERVETMFYFPAPSGDEGFALYPVQVARNEQVIAAGESRRLKAVEALSELDEASWDHLSQYGTEKQVLDYLTANNLHRLDLSRIAWRARENVDFLRRSTALIGSLHGYNDTLWSYGIHHNDTAIAREFLKHREDFLARCGKALDGELASLDPVERRWYQQLDYAPLVNARSHRLGREHRILNDRFARQYGEFLDVLAHLPELDAEDRLAVAAYLSLQDRIEEALAWLESVPEAEVVSRLQYDYLKAFHAFHREDPGAAKAIAATYASYPVEKWRKSFAEVAKQANEIEGDAAEPRRNEPNQDTREGQIERLSSQEPLLDLTATGRNLNLRHRNLGAVTVNYYEMDLELLFSSRPFVSAGSEGFSFVRPNLVETKELPVDGAALAFTVPETFASKNVLVEVVGGGRTSSAAVYSNRLDLRLAEGQGRFELRHEETGKPLGRAYVKVYARMEDGSTRFFKDGYTDLRGVFDYSSLSTDELDRVQRLSLLVMSEANGSLVREVAPPQR